MTIHLKVKPGSKVDRLFYDAAGQLTAKIRAPAQDGKANAYLIEFLAKQLGVAKSAITARLSRPDTLPNTASVFKIMYRCLFNEAG